MGLVAVSMDEVFVLLSSLTKRVPSALDGWSNCPLPWPCAALAVVEMFKLTWLLVCEFDEPFATATALLFRLSTVLV